MILKSLLYLRILISSITIDSRSTISYIRKTLSELDDYMVSIDCNTTTINGFVQLQKEKMIYYNEGKEIDEDVSMSWAENK